MVKPGNVNLTNTSSAFLQHGHFLTGSQYEGVAQSQYTSNDTATKGTPRIKALTLLRSDYVDDPLPLVAEAKVGEPISFNIILQRHALKA